MWTVNKAVADEIISPNDANNSANFYFDYSSYGIPSAPHSTGGTTRGLGRRGPSKTLYRFRAHGSQRSSSGAPRISSRGVSAPHSTHFGIGNSSPL